MSKNDTPRKRLHWRRRYRMVIYNADTYEELSHFKFSIINFLTILVAIVVLFIVLTGYIIAFTPLREYIPGYTDVSLYQRLYNLEQRADSMEIACVQKDTYINNIRRIVTGDSFESDSLAAVSTKTIPQSELKNIEFKKSEQDSILRATFEQETQYSLYGNVDMKRHLSEVKNFFVPLEGIITSHFNRNENHLGIDIVANNDEIIKSILDGTVVYADWSITGGYVIGIQHSENVFSVYKHNSSLLKKEGDFVRAGEAIAYFGETGELSTGPHLHFELWINGTAVNPEEYITFEKKI